MTTEQILEKVDQLKTIEKEVKTDILIQDNDQLKEHAQELISIKKAIKMALMDRTEVLIPEDEHSEERAILQDIALGKKLPIENEIKDVLSDALLQKWHEWYQPDTELIDLLGDLLKDKNQDSGKILEILARSSVSEELINLGVIDELSSEEREDLIEEYFYGAGIDGYSYVERLYHIGTLIARIGKLPDTVSPFLKEIKECYALFQDLAVCTLCRTVLEVSVRHLYELEEFTDPESEKHQFAIRYFIRKYGDDYSKYVDYYDLSFTDMTNILCDLDDFKRHKWPLKDLYKDLSRIIHGNVTSVHAYNILKNTLQLVHDLYEV